MKTFVPFHKIEKQQVTIVDGLHPQNLCLSHWKGANYIEEIAADTSGEIVLNALSKNYPGVNNRLVSATHFDIDGFVGVFALFYPKTAMQNKQELKAMAQIGDFREFKKHNGIHDFALKLCCWINKVEKDRFYRPFESKNEIENCVEKFELFLPLFKKVINNIEDYKEDWKEEYEAVQNGIQNELSSEVHDSIGLVKKEFKKPSHYYALFSETQGYDIVLSIYPNQRYELEYKYTTWIDLASRSNLPRIDLKPLAALLNHMEHSEYNWQVDSISDTGPILRLEASKLSKADRYANPAEREIYTSSISVKEFKKTVITYLNRAFKGLEAKKNWTWSEMRKLKGLI
ncbi:hypothetical protein N9502_02565 [Vicingaceae bacterium]|nr:hypothetical protein [Vicingaceae bacterium]